GWFRAPVAVAVRAAAAFDRQSHQPQGRGPSAAATIHLRHRILNMRIALFAIVSAIVLGSAVLPATAQQAAPPAQSLPVTGKLGFVNTERILRDAVPAQRAQKKIEAEFQRRDQELAKIAEQLKRMQDDLDKNAMTMGETQRRNRERE